MEVNLANNVQTDSIVDGEGLRIVVWFQGCSHKCLGCHNPSTHEFNKGIKTTVDKVSEEIFSVENHDGITLTGGDPLFQIEAALSLVKQLKKHKKNIWCYTGFTFEEILLMSKSNPSYLEFLKNIDVLVDGRFILEQRSLSLKFRGSKNQRILNVKRSLKENRACSIRKYKSSNNQKSLKPSKSYLFV